MVEKSLLLQIIQFVGLIAPATAILTELLIRFHGGLDEIRSKRKLPFEIQVLFIGIGAILIGGMAIGIQLTLSVQDSLTQVTMGLIFIGLPFLALSIAIVNIRISSVYDQSSSLLEVGTTALRLATSVVMPATLSIALFIWPLVEFDDFINSEFALWIFNGDFSAVWFFYGASIILVYKTMISLWSHNHIPNVNIPTILKSWFVVAFTVLTSFWILSIPVFIIYLALLSLELPFVTIDSVLGALPYFWSIILVIALLYAEIDPDEENSETEDGPESNNNDNNKTGNEDDD